MSETGLSQFPGGFSRDMPVLPRFDPRALPRMAVRPFQRQLPLGLDRVAKRTDAPPSGQRARVTKLRADALMAWLLALNSEDLPPIRDTAAQVAAIDTQKRVFEAYRHLDMDGRIVLRHGTPHACKGERLVRIVANGRILKTLGCTLTFDSPPNRRAHQVGVETLRRVHELVETCAAERLYLPAPERIGARLGRSGDIVVRALRELHDAGALTLIQHGMRRAARLPDGRSTL